MATQTMSERKARPSIVAPFGIEADDTVNGDLLVQGIPDCRLRSAVKPIKTVFGKTPEGMQEEQPVPAGLINLLPANIPGMQLHLNPGDGSYKVIDPLTGQDELLERIRLAMQKANVGVATKLRAVPMQEGRLGPDEMKTLVRQVVCFVESGCAKVVRGVLPSMDDVDELPGNYLLNPGARTDWSLPRYEKDLEVWKQKLNRLG